MPNFRPLAPLVWEEDQVTDTGRTDKMFLLQSKMKFLTPPLLRLGGIAFLHHVMVAYIYESSLNLVLMKISGSY